jgi:hypothetical protein
MANLVTNASFSTGSTSPASSHLLAEVVHFFLLLGLVRNRSHRVGIAGERGARQRFPF